MYIQNGAELQLQKEAVRSLCSKGAAMAAPWIGTLLFKKEQSCQHLWLDYLGVLEVEGVTAQ